MIKTCPICEKDFESTNNKEKFCSPACKVEGNRQRTARNNTKRILPVDKICPICGQHFPRGKNAQKYCSLECAKQGKRKVNTNHGSTDWGKYDLEDPNKINVNPEGWLKYAIERGLVTQCPMCGEWTRSESGFCPKHENNH